jgi:outer membrane protein, multidrug efflux system
MTSRCFTRTMNFRINRFVSVSACTTVLVLSGCANLMPPAQVPMVVAPAWHAPLPHQGTLSSLSNWWQQQGDPLLVELIEAAQAASPSVAQAVSRIATTRADQATANAALIPNLSAQASASRGVSDINTPVATSLQAGVQASWELDLIGANRAVSRAAQAQVEGSQAQWHDARVSVAAEVANTYYSYASCTRQLVVTQRDAASRLETARLTAINAKAGFVAPSVAAQARASAAEANSRLTQQARLCELDVKALVALTAVPEPDLRQKMALAQVVPGQIAMFSIVSLPAQTVSQRPDVFAAERDVVLASAQVGSAKAEQWPRLSLSGSIGALRVSSGGSNIDLTTWSVGPLSLTLPLFDGGQRAANVQSAYAAYQSAVVTYRGKVRQAVREVEEALLTLHSVETRQVDAEVSTQGYAESLAATQQRFDQGLASLMELEHARRSALAAESSVLTLALERQQAWVTLYRAVGGGFEPDKLASQTPPVTLTGSSL